MKLIIRWHYGSMEEMATVVVDVLAVVGGVDHHCLRTLGTQHLNKAVEDMVGIKNSVVVGI